MSAGLKIEILDAPDASVEDLNSKVVSKELEEHFLRIRDISRREDLEKLSYLLSRFDLEDAVARYEETKDLVDFITKCARIPSMKFPTEFFHEGIKSYIFGFNEAAVFYSFLSVELAVLLRASKKLGEKKMSQIEPFRFLPLIREAKIFDKKHAALAKDLYRLRNCYVHFENQILYSRILFEKGRKFFETYQDERIPKQIIDETVKDIRVLQRYMENNFPSLPSLVRKKTAYIDFMRRRFDSYVQWVFKEKKWTYRKVLEGGPREILRILQGRFDAFDALDSSKCLLEFCTKRRRMKRPGR